MFDSLPRRAPGNQGDASLRVVSPRTKTAAALDDAADARRHVPSVDALLRSAPGVRAAEQFGRAVVRQALRDTLAEIRDEAERGGQPPDDEVVMARALGAAARVSYGLSEVINATGVVLHTGLGRAPLPAVAAKAATAAAHGYSDLEVDRETGSRGRRTTRAETLLKALTGAEAALVVNNNAAALLLALAGLITPARKEVLVSRGELIEIGGEFRLPDIMAASGARLVEVGTTNRTRPNDYRRALTRRTAMILKVHPSNYRVVGFTNSVGAPALAEIARGARIPLVHDVGSGLLERYPEVPNDEPAVTEALAGGADVVTFSGDKLLGGPQAGILTGRADLIDTLRRHPLARALRVDKMTVAALEAVLRLYATGRRLEIPLWTMLSEPQRSVTARARAVAKAFKGATVRGGHAVAGGGSLPEWAIPSAEMVLPVPRAEQIAARLRNGRPPVFARTEEGAVVFDLRTVPPRDEDRLVRAIRYALEQDEPPKPRRARARSR
ncbi:MAG TPA: L-seryl-tRNA(Sec) selenium transferase [Actinobacteria bacterium]|nr:L-seryl-tRNA(Sec) selenium transferase [Actinomycetota bacterium]